MDLDSLVRWTKSKFSRFRADEVPVTTSVASDALTSGRAAVPALDIFENDSEFRVVVDVPGATPRNTHVAWNDFDTLTVRVDREATASGTAWSSEYEESDWYREIVLYPDVDGAKVSATVRDGVATIRLPKQRTASNKLVPVLAG